MICDFCLDVAEDVPERSYKGKPFAVPGIVTYYDDGEFLACPGCDKLIKEKEWEALKDRCIDRDYVDLFLRSVGW